MNRGKLAEIRVCLYVPEDVNDATTDAMIAAYEDLEIRSRVEILVMDLVESRWVLDGVEVRVREE